MKTEIAEMERLLRYGSRQEILDYLKMHCDKSRDGMALRIKLMDKELMLRNTESVETEKTNQLLKNSQRNKGVG